MTFKVPITLITSVEDHPGPDGENLTIVHVNNQIVVSNRQEDGSARYNIGDPVMYCPVGSIIPEWILKIQGYWDTYKNRGLLDGANYNRVKARKIRGVLSSGIIFPVAQTPIDGRFSLWNPSKDTIEDGEGMEVEEGFDAAEYMDIKEFVK